MSQTDQFWQYAREAILSACDAQTSEDKQDRPAGSGNRAVRGNRRTRRSVR
jgi:hypothetical protein